MTTKNRPAVEVRELALLVSLYIEESEGDIVSVWKKHDSFSMRVFADYMNKAVRQEIPKIHGFAEEVVSRYDDREFRKDFRISRSTFDRLVEEMSAKIKYEECENSGGKTGLSAVKQMFVFVWYMSNQDSMREIGRLFGISVSTVHKCIRQVADGMSRCDIKEKIIEWPDIENQNVIAQTVEERYGIPNVTGFIDGTHIRLA